jgi:hypothetical protein
VAGNLTRPVNVPVLGITYDLGAETVGLLRSGTTVTWHMTRGGGPPGLQLLRLAAQRRREVEDHCDARLRHGGVAELRPPGL